MQANEEREALEKNGADLAKKFDKLQEVHRLLTADHDTFEVCCCV